MMAFKLAWRQLRSQWAAGEVRVLIIALVLAVTATTSVGFFTDRIQSSLQTQGNILLGADLVVSADHVPNQKYQAEANSRQFKAIQTQEFPSMVMHGDLSQLAEIKAVEAGFPLRGDLTISQQLHGASHVARDVPKSGTVWIEPRLATQLNLQVGDSIDVGESTLKVDAILQREASRGGDMFSIAPRLMMNAKDVQATKLIQFGSRVKYQLLVAGDRQSILDFSAWLKPQLARGERIADIASARPEMKSALEKAQQFLGLSSMVGVILAMVAMFLASLPYVQKSLDTYALMRCFGASKQLIVRILLWQTTMLALLGSLIGCLLGYFAQLGLAELAGTLFLETLPAPGVAPALVGLLSGFATMLAVVWPHLLRLRDVPALRILRRDLGDQAKTSWLSFTPGLAVLSGLVLWHAGDLKLGGAALLGLLVLVLVTSLIALYAGRLLSRLPSGSVGAWKLGLAGLKRRPLMATAQAVGISLGLMALILLALVRGDLLQNWQSSLPADAPNRFVINIQPAQVAGIHDFFAKAAISNASVFPMVKGRLIAINQQALDTKQYQDERARRLAEREFNLSWAADMQSDNLLVSGRWWQANEHGKPMLSLEQGLAESLHLKVGDILTYDIAGNKLDLVVSSLRKVEWDSMRANFFAVTPPSVLESFDASYITSFHLPVGKEDTLNQLLRSFPNLTVIDVAALMEQVRGIMGKMTYAIEYVFGFSVLAGLAVLYAALVATREERVREATLLRVLGASRRQVTLAILAEFFCIGLIAALVASLAANAVAYYVSVHLLSIPYHLNLLLTLSALLLSVVLVPFAAWIGTRSFLNQAPRALLQSI